MTSAASRKAKQITFSAPQRLTPSEIESLRAHKKDLTRQVRDIRTRQAAERTMTEKMTEKMAAETKAAE